MPKTFYDKNENVLGVFYTKDELDSNMQPKMSTSSVNDGTIDKNIGFDSQGNIVKQIASGGGRPTVTLTLNYDSIEDSFRNSTPIDITLPILISVDDVNAWLMFIPTYNNIGLIAYTEQAGIVAFDNGPSISLGENGINIALELLQLIKPTASGSSEVYACVYPPNPSFTTHLSYDI